MAQRVKVLMRISSFNHNTFSLCHAVELLDNRQTTLGCGLVGQDENLIVLTLGYGFSERTIQLV